MTREPIYAAVFAFFARLTNPTIAVPTPLFKTATRKLQHWDGVAGEDQPALLMQQRRESAVRRRGLPTIWTLHPVLFLYVRTNAQNDPTQIPALILNPLLDAIEGALEVDDLINNACTLGGLVSHCAIDGDIEIFQGDQGDEEVATIPLSILTSP